MVKSDTSIRSLSHGKVTTVSIDTVLLADIKSLANGRSNVGYLRELVEKDKRSNPQGVMSSLSTPKSDISSTLKAIEAKIDAILSYELLSKADVQSLKGAVVNFIESEESTSDAGSYALLLIALAGAVAGGVVGMNGGVKNALNALRRALAVEGGQGELKIT